MTVIDAVRGDLAEVRAEVDATLDRFLAEKARTAPDPCLPPLVDVLREFVAGIMETVRGLLNALEGVFNLIKAVPQLGPQKGDRTPFTKLQASATVTSPGDRPKISLVARS